MKIASPIFWCRIPVSQPQEQKLPDKTRRSRLRSCVSLLLSSGTIYKTGSLATASPLCCEIYSANWTSMSPKLAEIFILFLASFFTCILLLLSFPPAFTVPRLVFSS